MDYIQHKMMWLWTTTSKNKIKTKILIVKVPCKNIYGKVVLQNMVKVPCKNINRKVVMQNTNHQTIMQNIND